MYNWHDAMVTAKKDGFFTELDEKMAESRKTGIVAFIFQCSSKIPEDHPVYQDIWIQDNIGIKAVHYEHEFYLNIMNGKVDAARVIVSRVQNLLYTLRKEGHKIEK